MRVAFAGVALFALAAGTSGFISSGWASSYGDPAGRFVNADVGAAFVGLNRTLDTLQSAHGAAVVLSPGIAVINAHNANIVAPAEVLSRSPQYDLLLFRVTRGTPIAVGQPKEGERVIAYGQGENGELRTSYGVVRRLKVPVRPACPVCAVQETFVFESNAGPGFGGPVLDAGDGRLLGIIFGYGDTAEGKRVMYAYDMARVHAELSALSKPVAMAQR